MPPESNLKVLSQGGLQHQALRLDDFDKCVWREECDSRLDPHLRSSRLVQWNVLQQVTLDNVRGANRNWTPPLSIVIKGKVFNIAIMICTI